MCITSHICKLVRKRVEYLISIPNNGCRPSSLGEAYLEGSGFASKTFSLVFFFFQERSGEKSKKTLFCFGEGATIGGICVFRCMNQYLKHTGDRRCAADAVFNGSRQVPPSLFAEAKQATSEPTGNI